MFVSVNAHFIHISAVLINDLSWRKKVVHFCRRLQRGRLWRSQTYRLVLILSSKTSGAFPESMSFSSVSRDLPLNVMFVSLNAKFNQMLSLIFCTNCISYLQGVNELFTTLPRLPSHLPIIAIKASHVSITNTDFRVNHLTDALMFLKENSDDYANIHISLANAATYPRGWNLTGSPPD